MSYYRLTFLLCFYLSTFHVAFSQPASFQISMDSTGFRLGDVMVNEDDEIVALFFGPPYTILSNDAYLVNLTDGVAAQDAVKLSFNDFTRFKTLLKTGFSSDRILFLVHTALGPSAPLVLVSYDLNTQNIWARKPKYSSFMSDFIKSETGKILFLNTPGNVPHNVELYCLDTLGNTLWRRGINLSKPGFDTFQIEAQAIEASNDGGYFMVGKFGNYNNSGQDEYFVMKLNANGYPIILKTIGEYALDQLYVGKDGVYLLGKTPIPFPFAENNENAMLARLSMDLEFEWAKVYHASAFEYSKSTLNFTSDGGLILGYSTSGAFPVILAKLDSSGNILWQKGYPFYEPQLDAMNDGGLLLTTWSHFDSTGAVFPKMIISRTDSLGNLSNCPIFPTCLESDAIELNLGGFNADTFSIDSLENVDLSSGWESFTFSGFCDIPAPPSPYFELPDTICYGDSVQTENTYNALAHRIKWHLTGGDTDSIVYDSGSFGYRFNDPGQFLLRQTIWFLGCAYSYEKSITVLEELTAAIDPPGIVCDTSGVTLHVNANRELKDFLWNTGANHPQMAVSESGTYSVTVSDGYCQAVDSAEITMITSILNNAPAFYLPEDTFVCKGEFPFLLFPVSAFTNRFSVNNVSTPQLPIELYKEGDYVISADIEGCIFSSVFSLNEKDCSSVVYLPNIFSPNGDGVNDLFFAQGKDFLPISMTIFDRWGGIVKEIRENPVEWDGKGLGPGVYVYVFEYLNLLTNAREKITGSLTLIR